MIPRVVAITPGRRGPWVARLPVLVDAGVDGLIVRLVDDPGGLDEVLAALPQGLCVMVRPVAKGDRERAQQAGIGLHLPAFASVQGCVRAPAQGQGGGLLGASCHGLGELKSAEQDGCDYALYSPVFSPRSKPGDRRVTMGLEGLGRGCAAVSTPVLALAGVTSENAAACVRAGAHGVAAIGAFFADGRVVEAQAAALVDAVGAAVLRS